MTSTALLACVFRYSGTFEVFSSPHNRILNILLLPGTRTQLGTWFILFKCLKCHVWQDVDVWMVHLCFLVFRPKLHLLRKMSLLFTRVSRKCLLEPVITDLYTQAVQIKYLKLYSKLYILENVVNRKNSDIYWMVLFVAR